MSFVTAQFWLLKVVQKFVGVLLSNGHCRSSIGIHFNSVSRPDFGRPRGDSWSLTLIFVCSGRVSSSLGGG